MGREREIQSMAKTLILKVTIKCVLQKNHFYCAVEKIYKQRGKIRSRKTGKLTYSWSVMIVI